MFPRLFLIVFLTTLTLSSAKAQSTVPASSPTAVALASQALKALAGATGLTDITLQASANYIAGSDQETGTATLVARGNVQSHVTLNLSEGTRQEIRNGPSGAWSGPDGVQHAMALHNCWADASWFFPALTLQALSSDPTLGVVYLGPAEWNGVAALHLQFLHLVPGQAPGISTQIQGLSTVDLYLDPKSLLPLALDFNTHPDNDLNQNIPVEIQFGDYRAVNGVQVPFRIQKFLQGTLTLDFTVTQVAPNSGVSTSTFTIPELPTGGAQ
jgi:hypothetical protein